MNIPSLHTASRQAVLAPLREGAATAFEGGNFEQGLIDSFYGFDDTTLSPGEWLLVGGADAATGAALPDIGYFDFAGPLTVPTDFADAHDAASALMTVGQDYLTEASTAFGLGDTATGLYDFVTAVDFLGVLAPEELVLGVATAF